MFLCFVWENIYIYINIKSIFSLFSSITYALPPRNSIKMKKARKIQISNINFCENERKSGKQNRRNFQKISKIAATASPISEIVVVTVIAASSFISKIADTVSYSIIHLVLFLLFLSTQIKDDSSSTSCSCSGGSGGGRTYRKTCCSTSPVQNRFAIVPYFDSYNNCAVKIFNAITIFHDYRRYCPILTGRLINIIYFYSCLKNKGDHHHYDIRSTV